MSNYATLKAAIQSAVYTNGNNEITGAGLQAVLLQIVNTVGDGYVFNGVATAGTAPGTPDANVFYIAPSGTYTNFGGTYIVNKGEIGFFMFDGAWTFNKITLELQSDDLNRYGFNVTVNGLVTGVHTILTACKNVPARYRMLGQKITFDTGEGWQTWQFQSLSLGEYEDASKWVQQQGIEQLTGNINITNDADEEDITSTDNLLKFADKEHSIANYSGLGRVYLRKNIVNGVNRLTQAMIAKANTIYIIQYNYDLNGETIEIPANCILKFEGGSLNNGTLTGAQSIIEAEKYGIFLNVLLNGDYINSYIYPEWFGAVGDGESDDTAAFRIALYVSDLIGVPVFISPVVYLISGTLNYYDNEYKNYLHLQIQGTQDARAKYNPDRYGCITYNTDISVFANAEFGGYIKDIIVIGTRTLGNYMFYNSTCRALDVTGCMFSQIGAFFADSSLLSVSRIEGNRFLSVYWFSKFINKNTSITDSFIKDNYINGGIEYPDNAFSNWGYGNGCIIEGNFIDYYRIIYEPKATSNQGYQGPQSIGNQYQVFRYFYHISSANHITSGSFSSVGDAFNWTNPSSLEHLRNMTPLTLTVNGITEDMPPYIFTPRQDRNIIIINAKLESNLDPPIYLANGFGGYNIRNTFTIGANASNLRSASFFSTNGCFNGGTYNTIPLFETNYIIHQDSLPSFSVSWSKVPTGTLVEVNNIVYKAVIYYDEALERKVAKWKNVITGEYYGDSQRDPRISEYKILSFNVFTELRRYASGSYHPYFVYADLQKSHTSGGQMGNYLPAYIIFSKSICEKYIYYENLATLHVTYYDSNGQMIPFENISSQYIPEGFNRKYNLDGSMYNTGDNKYLLYIPELPSNIEYVGIGVRCSSFINNVDVYCDYKILNYVNTEVNSTNEWALIKSASFSGGNSNRSNFEHLGESYFDTQYVKPAYYGNGAFIDSNGNTLALRVGTTANRPTGLTYARDRGYMYFDTTLGKPIFVKTVTDQDEIIWVDATGATV